MNESTCRPRREGIVGRLRIDEQRLKDRSRRAAAGRAQLLANFVHELDDVWRPPNGTGQTSPRLTRAP